MVRSDKTILIVETSRIAFALRQMLDAEGYRLVEAQDYQAALGAAASKPIDLAIVSMHGTDDQVGSRQGLETVRALKRDHAFPILVTMRQTGLAETRAALQYGAYDYLVRPLTTETVLPVVRTALERSALVRSRQSTRRPVASRGATSLVGTSRAMGEVRTLIRRVANNPDASVLILGESGTGKELVARAIHHESHRREGPFVAVNCGALPANLVETELFGHERGAFTGAEHTRLGKFEQAHNGTIFLDEIREMHPDTQVKLLRVLEDRHVARIGSARDIPVDIRVVAATNADLGAAVAAGRFRADVFFRLDVFRVELPPLRDRGEDVALLAGHFLQEKLGTPVELPEALCHQLAGFSWPGNVRELRNAVERATILAGPQPSDVLAELARYCHSPSSVGGIAPVGSEPTTEVALDDALRRCLANADTDESLLEHVDRRLVSLAYQMSGRNKAATARLLGCSRKTLERRVVKYGLDD